jgi:trimethylamine--corrinoid protein Co-methyltransferase
VLGGVQHEVDAAEHGRQQGVGALVGGLGVRHLGAAQRAAGWLEGGLVSSYEKFVMDADQLGMMRTMLEGVDLSENGQAMDAIREVGPGAHFLGCAHTQANFETAFFRSSIADNNTYEQWLAEGERDAATRAGGLAKKLLDEYEAPAIDPGVDEALVEFMAKKKAAFPDSNI